MPALTPRPAGVTRLGRCWQRPARARWPLRVLRLLETARSRAHKQTAAFLPVSCLDWWCNPLEAGSVCNEFRHFFKQRRAASRATG